ncbi:MAG: DUF6498-containing protein [FCB group bacterium]|jgi:hypothetical protein|nr:DUF6498-containing protein [FCB group bacterium]
MKFVWPRKEILAVSLLGNAGILLTGILAGFSAPGFVMLYWLEGLPIGGFAIARMLLVDPAPTLAVRSFWLDAVRGHGAPGIGIFRQYRRIVLICFILPYILYNAIFGLIALVFNAGYSQWGPGDAATSTQISLGMGGLVFVLLVAQHAALFLINFVFGEERYKASLQKISLEPFLRLSYLPPMMVGCYLAVYFLGDGLVPLAILIFIRIAWDLALDSWLNNPRYWYKPI